MQRTQLPERNSCNLLLKHKWRSIYNRTYFWLIAIVILCVTFLLLNYLVDTHSDCKGRCKNYNGTGARSINISRAKVVTINSRCTSEDCRILCANSTNLEGDFNQIVQDANCSTVEVLHVNSQKFPLAALEKNWIHNQSTISELMLTNSDLIEIKSEAFNSDAFTSTLGLSLLDLPLTNLSAGTLLGLSKLERLTIACTLEKIDRGFFQPVSASLRLLKLNYMQESVKFERIFGISKMINLVHLDLSGNHFRTITNQGLNHSSKVEYLNLSNSSINVVGVDAFRPVQNTLKYLDLSHNKIKRIGTDEFGGILSNGIVYIYLSENPWVCDCELHPLVECLEKYPNRFLDRPYCKHPRRFYGLRIGQKSLCENDPTAPSTTVSQDFVEKTSPGREVTSPANVGSRTPGVTAGWTSTSSADRRKVVKLACSEHRKAKPTLYTTASFNYLNLLPPLYDFEVIPLNNTAAEVVIHELEHQVNLLWHTDYEEPGALRIGDLDYGCLAPHNRSLIIDNLKTNLSYTFCLIPDGETSVSPFNCQPFHLPDPKSSEHQEWISHDKKRITLIVVGAVLLVATFAGGTMSYFLLKRFPDLLRGSKHVLIVKKSAASKISTISGMDEILSHSTSTRRKKKITPPPPYQSLTSQAECTYENPEDLRGYEIPRRHTYNFEKCELTDALPRSPPPLPKRNSEPTNKIVEMERSGEH